MKTEPDLREDLLRFGHLCYERRLLVAMDGNLSVRLPRGLVLCTRAGCHKGFLTDDDLLVVDPEGKVRRGQGRPTSEIFMHLACYRERPDVQAVIHAHPPLCVAFTIAGLSMDRCVLPEVVLTLGAIPTAPYRTTGTPDLAALMGEYVRSWDAILMDTHGAICVGPDLLTAFCRLETMEHTALILKTAQDLGGVRNLPPEEAVRLRRLGLERYGGPPAAVAALNQPGTDLPESCTVPGESFRLLRVTSKPLTTLGEPAGKPAPALDPDVEEAVVREVMRLMKA
ncbi:MAG: class II aldolase/adducin family protein [Pseudomonadota bacterium]